MADQLSDLETLTAAHSLQIQAILGYLANLSAQATAIETALAAVSTALPDAAPGSSGGLATLNTSGNVPADVRGPNGQSLRLDLLPAVPRTSVFVPATVHVEYRWNGLSKDWNDPAAWTVTGIGCDVSAGPFWPGDTSGLGQQNTDMLFYESDTPPTSLAGLTVISHREPIPSVEIYLASLIVRGQNCCTATDQYLNWTFLITVTGQALIGTPGGSDAIVWLGQPDNPCALQFFANSIVPAAATPFGEQDSGVINDNCVFNDASLHAGPASGKNTILCTSAAQTGTFNGDVILVKPCDLSAATFDANLYCWVKPLALPLPAKLGGVIYYQLADTPSPATLVNQTTQGLVPLATATSVADVLTAVEAISGGGASALASGTVQAGATEAGFVPTGTTGTIPPIGLVSIAPSGQSTKIVQVAYVLNQDGSISLRWATNQTQFAPSGTWSIAPMVWTANPALPVTISGINQVGIGR